MNYMNSRLKGLSIFLIFTLASATALADDGGKFGATLYGTARLDAIYETNNSFNGDYIVNPRPQPANGMKTDTFTMTANQSLVGVNLTAPSFAGADVSGKIEYDFYSPLNTIGYRTAPELRQAYVMLNWADMKFSILAGQTWDTFFFVPKVLNYGQFYRAGNMGYRRPMLRLSKGIDIGSTELKADVALARPTSDTGLSEGNSSADSGSPGLQGRISYAFPLLTEKKTIIGVSGSKSNPRTFKTAPGPLGPDMSTYYTANQWHVGVDLTLPILSNLLFTGRWYRGADLSQFIGLSSSVYTTSDSQMENGGFVALAYNMTDALSLQATYGFAVLENANEAVAGAATKNIVWGLQAKYKMTKELTVGMEYEDWASTFVGGLSYPDHRYQTAMMLDF
jgi:hypothetical protein